MRDHIDYFYIWRYIMISEIQMQSNKARFIELVNSINREGFLKENLLAKLENSDFFFAPASTKYHGNYKGGLCEHCLQVYDNLVQINETKDLHFNEDSMKILALFHDISKMNFYEEYFQNKKVYYPGGSKRDEGGNYDWKAVASFKVREAKDRFVFGNHEQTSEFMLRSYCPLTYEESIAILHHHAGMSWDCAQDNISEVYNKYPIAMYLHVADMIGCYWDQRIDE